MQAQAGCTEYNPVRRRADWFVYFGVSTFKGLLSIPCDGRGARRPQGQSFRKSVGPAALYQVSAANRRDILIRWAYEQAMRATEICSLQVKDFDISTGTLYLHLQRFEVPDFTVQPLMS